MKQKNKPILVVEDDVDLCNSIMLALNREGYTTQGATEMREGMFKVKNEKFSCILLDMKLGNDTGVELLQFIRERRDTENAATPVVVISGILDKALVERLTGNIQGALVKPFEMDSLLGMVKRQLKSG